MADIKDVLGMPSRSRVEGEIFFDASPSFNALDKRSWGYIKKTSTLPSVKNCEHWITQNTAPITVTDFSDGQPGQHLYILGDGQTTLQNGAKISMFGGANLLLASGKLYHLVRLNNVWNQF